MELDIMEVLMKKKEEEPEKMRMLQFVGKKVGACVADQGSWYAAELLRVVPSYCSSDSSAHDSDSQISSYSNKNKKQKKMQLLTCQTKSATLSSKWEMFRNEF